MTDEALVKALLALLKRQDDLQVKAGHARPQDVVRGWGADCREARKALMAAGVPPRAYYRGE